MSPSERVPHVIVFDSRRVSVPVWVVTSGAMKGLLVGAILIPAVVAIVSARQAGSELEVLQIRPNFYLIAGAGANVGVQVGEDGVIVVDAGAASNAGDVVAAIRKISSAPIRYVINTNADADHVGGNETISKAGVTLLGTRVTGLPGSANFNGPGPAPASILAMEQVLGRMSAPTGQSSPFSVASWPTETFEFGYKNLYLNGEGIEVLHQPAAHSDGDAIVFFRRSDVIVAGDILDTTRFPVIDVAKGGSIQGEIDALNRLVQMAIPSVPIITREAGTSVIPGHGRVCDQFDVVFYRDMITIIRDRVRDMKSAGMTLEQVKAALAGTGVRGPVRVEFRSLDDEPVHRGHLSQPGAGEIVTRGPAGVSVLISLMLLAAATPSSAQRGGAAAPSRSARESAPVDLTGYWVSFVTEDWRFRMMTPPKGDYARVPLSPEGRKVADGWNPAADQAAGNECKAFGAAAHHARARTVPHHVAGRCHACASTRTPARRRANCALARRRLRASGHGRAARSHAGTRRPNR